MADINTLVSQTQLLELPRRERKKQETRWRIFDAAFELFAEQGYEEVKIEQICTKADVSNATFFHHFTNKVALVRTFLDRIKLEVGNKLQQAGEISCTEQLQLVNHEVKQAAGITASFSPQLLTIFNKKDTMLDMAHMDTGITGTVSGIIRSGQQSGEFSHKHNPDVIAAALIASWIVLPLAKESPGFPSNAHEEVLDLLLAGLTAAQ